MRSAEPACPSKGWKPIQPKTVCGHHVHKQSAGQIGFRFPLSLTLPDIFSHSKVMVSHFDKVRVAICSTDFQTGDGDQRQQCRTDPKSNDNFEFMLSFEQIVIVQRAARDQTVARDPEPTDLKNDA